MHEVVYSFLEWVMNQQMMMGIVVVALGLQTNNKNN
jgi:hypothetical protein